MSLVFGEGCEKRSICSEEKRASCGEKKRGKRGKRVV